MSLLVLLDLPVVELLNLPSPCGPILLLLEGLVGYLCFGLRFGQLPPNLVSVVGVETAVGSLLDFAAIFKVSSALDLPSATSFKSAIKT